MNDLSSEQETIGFSFPAEFASLLPGECLICVGTIFEYIKKLKTGLTNNPNLSRDEQVEMFNNYWDQTKNNIQNELHDAINNKTIDDTINNKIVDDIDITTTSNDLNEENVS